MHTSSTIVDTDATSTKQCEAITKQCEAITKQCESDNLKFSSACGVLKKMLITM